MHGEGESPEGSSHVVEVLVSLGQPGPDWSCLGRWTLAEELPPSAWPVGMSVGIFLISDPCTGRNGAMPGQVLGLCKKAG